MHKSPYIALIDMDGTLADYDAVMNVRLAELRSPDEPAFPMGDEPQWLKARKRLIKNAPGFWHHLPRIPDGFAVLDQIIEVGFETHVLTKGPFKTSSAWTEKLTWCHRELPETLVTITSDKSLVYGRVLFDDWPPYVTRWLEWRPRGLVIMLDQPWNQGFEHPNVFRYHQFRRTLPSIDSAPTAADVQANMERMRVQDAALKERLLKAKNR